MMDQHTIDLLKRQKTSMAFLQAQNDIHQDILNRRREITVKKLFNERDYKRYQDYMNPYVKNQVKAYPINR